MNNQSEAYRIGVELAIMEKLSTPLNVRAILQRLMSQGRAGLAPSAKGAMSSTRQQTQGLKHWPLGPRARALPGGPRLPPQPGQEAMAEKLLKLQNPTYTPQGAYRRFLTQGPLR